MSSFPKVYYPKRKKPVSNTFVKNILMSRDYGKKKLFSRKCAKDRSRMIFNLKVEDFRENVNVSKHEI